MIRKNFVYHRKFESILEIFTIALDHSTNNIKLVELFPWRQTWIYEDQRRIFLRNIFKGEWYWQMNQVSGMMIIVVTVSFIEYR